MAVVSKRDFSLHHLPPEILGLVTQFLHWNDLVNLVMVGDQLLSLQLYRPGAVEAIEVDIEWSFVPGRSFFWPKSLYRFSHLSKFSIPSEHNREIAAQGLTLSRLPHSLRTLEISASNVPDLLQPSIWQNAWTNLAFLFPQLTSLNLKAKLYDEQAEWARNLPPQLTHLQLQSWHTRVRLPDSIMSLRFEDITATTKSIVYPLSLTRLAITRDLRLLNPAILLIGLPPGFLHLHILKSGYTVRGNWIKHLPRLMETLEIHNSLGNSAGSSESLASYTELPVFPKTLTRLSIVIITHLPMWPLLPTTLTCLEFVESADPVHPTVLSSIPQTLHTLPRGLLDFTLPRLPGLNLGKDDLCLPPNLRRLSISGISLATAKALLHLKSLDLDYISLGVLKNLPDSLEELTIATIDLEDYDKINHHLPPNLRNLTVLDSRVGVVSLDNASVSKIYIDRGKMPRSIKHFVWKSHIDTSILLSFAHTCLTYLKLGICSNFTDQDVNCLQHVPGLTYLNLEGSQNITGSCFIHLPQGLQTLVLSESTQISDLQIQDLPRTLTFLKLDSALHLTNTAIPTLPRTLTFLSLALCKLITSKAFSLLHPTLKYHKGPSVICASWRIDSGVLRCFDNSG